MKRMRRFLIISLLIFISGCASVPSILIGSGKFVEMPQIVAHLEPRLKENKIFILGKILIQNPTQSDIELDKIQLTVKDKSNNVLYKTVLQWNRRRMMSKEELESPVNIEFDLSILDKQFLAVFLETGFSYKKLGIHIPVNSKVAVFHLEGLKEMFTRPVGIIINTKLRSDILGNAHIDYILDIANPTAMDLSLQSGTIRVYTIEEGEIAKVSVPVTLFKEGQRSQIKGSIELGNIFGTVIAHQFVKMHPLRFQLVGRLNIPKTGIYISFNVESAQEVDFSLFRH